MRLRWRDHLQIFAKRNAISIRPAEIPEDNANDEWVDPAGQIDDNVVELDEVTTTLWDYVDSMSIL